MALIPRRKTPTVLVGAVAVGSCHPVVVQSMTNTDTEDVHSTAVQVADLARAGSELVRITVNTPKAAAAVPAIKAALLEQGESVPLIGDFHYNGHLLLHQYPGCARALDKYRINPGNVGQGKHHDSNFRKIIEAAVRYERPVRIGVNWGSLDQALLTRLMDENANRDDPKDAALIMIDAMVQSAILSAKLAEEYGLGHERIILSAKTSRVQDLIDVYQKLAGECDYPLHLGLTEAGMGMRGVVASTSALSVLLQEGIGDTIRVSLTPKPGGDRREEVETCQHVLQSLGLRSFFPQVSACPGCGRTTSTFFQELAEEVQTHLSVRLKKWQERYPGVETLNVAVMGCVVNGPGESRHADIGISLPGTGEDPKAPVFLDGRHYRTLKGPELVQDFLKILDQYVVQRFSD